MAKTKGLAISTELSLPIDAVTATQVVYGGKGMGKTNYGGVLVEELSRAGLKWAVLDPMGVWWGIRHAADGKGAGVECLILGGAHGDIPIEPTGGAVVADLVADERVDVVIDISRKANGEMWSIGERIRFVTDYGKQLYKRQGSLVDGKRREPMMQVIDEAARFLPQMIRAGETDVAMCKSIWSAIVEEGRNVGIGVTLLTQRSARLNKDVAELADVMLAFRTIGPNSLDAVTDWLSAKVSKQELQQMAQSVRSLQIGSCLVVSPGWLHVEEIVSIRKRWTFDSSATPKPGERAAAVRGQGAKPDLAKYSTRMADTIERAKEDDPRALKSKVRELEAKLAKACVAAPAQKQSDAPLVESLRRQIGDLKNANTALKQRAADRQRKAGRLLELVTKSLKPLSLTMEQFLEEFKSEAPAAPLADVVTLPAPVPARPVLAPKPAAAARATETPQLDAAQTRILNSIAWLLGSGLPATSIFVAFLSGMSPTAGHFKNVRGSLRSGGLIEYLANGTIALTDAGSAAAETPAGLLSIEDLHEAVLAKLDGAQQKLLTLLLAAYPRSLTSDDLATSAGMTATAGHFKNVRGSLRSLGLVEYPSSGTVRAAPVLFRES